MTCLSPVIKRKSSLSPSRQHNLINRLARPKTHEWERRDKERLKTEQDTLTECTFTPNVNRRPPIFGETEYIRQRARVPIHERVLIENIEKEEKLQKLRAEQSTPRGSKNSSEHLFTPKISKKSEEIMRNRSRLPIQERIAIEIKEKKERLRNLKKEAEERETSLLRPPSASRRRSVSFEEVVDRISDRAKEVEKKKEAVKRRSMYEEERQLTFKPTINNTSRILAAHVTDLQSRPPSNSRRSVMNYDSHSFKPSIDKQSIKLLQQSNHPSVSETPEERAQRLYSEQKERERKRQLKEAQAQSKIKSQQQPKISEISKLIAPNTSIDDLASLEKRQKTHELAKKKLENEVNQHCTFRPAITDHHVEGNPFSLSVNDPNILGKTVKEIQQRKEKRLERLKRMKELEEQSQCSFKPKTNRRSSVDTPRTVLVRGFESHLEKCNHARKLKEEQDEIKRKVFYEDILHRGVSNSSTVPQSFELSNTSLSSTRRKLELSRKLKEDFGSSHTFQPMTVESKRRALAEKLISDHQR
ncbi:hypothetical protein P9112_004118 [Eukaryota sp. TZLM1-RC]